MSTVVDAMKAIGYRLGLTVSADTDPSMAECVAWLNEDVKFLLSMCAKEKSELGRTLGTITTIKGIITAITAADPGSVTCVAHGLDTGDIALIKDAGGMTDVNDTWVTITKVDADTFTISVDTSGYDAYTSGGYVYMAKYDDLASDMFAPCEMTDKNGNLHTGWIKKSNSRTRLELKTQSDCANYDPYGVAEPDRYYLDESNNIIFLQTPDAAYTIEIPYWKIQTELAVPHPITAITKADPGQITTDAYAFIGAETAYIESVVGMHDVNDTSCTLTLVSDSAGTYTIGVDTSSYDDYASGGYVTLATISANYTMPFNGLFDNLLIQSVVMKAQNKDEYDLSFELKWFEFISSQAKSLIHQRTGQSLAFTPKWR